jgi:predicted metal-binding membrane protein
VTADSTPLERALQRERAVLVVVLVIACGLSWAWIVAMGRDMYGSMSGASAWMMTATWDVTHLALLFAMWAVMMVAMMLPSAAPLLLLYGGVARRAASAEYSPAWVYLVAAGYIAVWSGFSLAATALQRALTSALVMSPMMMLVSEEVSGGLLIAAGVYQALPLKAACLRHCRAPAQFLTSHAQPGAWGAFRLGVAHGWYCLGCCWVLMLLLLAGGVMNLTVITGLAIVVAIEKLAPFGETTRYLLGIALVVAGVLVMLGPR